MVRLTELYSFSAADAGAADAVCIIRALTAAIVRNYYNSTRQPGEEYDRPTNHIIDTWNGCCCCCCCWCERVGRDRVLGIEPHPLSLYVSTACGSFDENVRHNFVNLMGNSVT